MDNQPINISFALIKITTEQFAVIEGVYNENAKIRIKTNLRFAADKVQKMIGVFSNFIFEDSEKPFILIEVGCHFIIQEESWNKMLNLETDTLLVPKSVLSHLAMLSVGTTRGVLHSKTENNTFNRFIIPTINVAAMIPDDVVLNFYVE